MHAAWENLLVYGWRNRRDADVDRDTSPPPAAHEVELAFARHDRVTVAEAAAATGMNRNEFSRRFRDLMGIPFKEFQLHRRLRSAAMEVRETDMPLKRIAARWGFADKSHFHNHFVRLFDCTPGAYRRWDAG